MRSIWNGSLRVGLLTIPVGIAPATVDQDIGFRTLHEPCGTPIKRVPFCGFHDAVVPAEELVRGFEVAKEQFVQIADEELAALAPEGTRTIDVRTFVSAGAIDIAAIGKTYFLTASESPIGRRPYVLLRNVLAERDQVGVARLDFRGSEWLAAIRAHRDRPLLVLQRLAYTDELVDAGPLERDLAGVEISSEEHSLAGELVGKLTRFRPTPSLFKSEHQARVRELVEAKLAGGTIVEPARKESEALTLPTADLADQLRRSIRGSRSRKKPKQRATARAGKR